MRIHVSTKVFVNIAESSELELYLQNASEVEVRKTTRLVSVKAVDRSIATASEKCNTPHSARLISCMHS